MRLARAGPPILQQRARAFLHIYLHNQWERNERLILGGDRWLNGRSIGELMPALYSCIPKRSCKARMVAKGLHGNAWARDIHGVLGIHEISQYLQLWHITQSTTLTDTLTS